MDGVKSLKRFGEEWFRRIGRKNILVGVSVTATVLVGGWVLYIIKLKVLAPPENILEAEKVVSEALADYPEIGEDKELTLTPQGSARHRTETGEGWTISFHGRARHTNLQLYKAAYTLVALGVRAIQRVRLKVVR
ncbi:MAG: hypothetical protein A3F33_01640 [Candidatus Woykebacteria bacterium RIFCSPHIGHO2_12_FULL_43_10]|uniref:Uncharacterized protein n=2 Tax=Candidatus Woykeibacteriota TaxID=1817899 RepID=A0A1G1WV56_9BACT|nr:MAG: hypothetical protein A2802_01840 [Candidatus Woykebacteria bacterium RIFCSPHIGHO2_01_FULL_43_29]OGY29518.1 MAG: hypothetical protein A3F33_01640 [Candidatus Woykebacteria bacterium RIFCSPHIGHO2_12_FULL_43_10]OGY29617.1 MAG: hypothetical protein A3J50_00180 [Candidatus Woykebacteria bacterium RIFCSPHIGHO2_02_FULL_43_16b]OGY31632.1 MAG: hypothetical protein A3A61_00370 [Candidatus Woykebacteria bacterium RIFCSPLOWO2_01_FULL_43_14]